MPMIDYFYAAHSSFAFLGSAKLAQVARKTGRTIGHRPMDLDKVLQACGAKPFSARHPDDVRYHFRKEIWRWAEFRGVEILDRRPQYHSNSYHLANRLLVASVLQGGDTDSLAHAFLVGHWRDDADLADPETLRALIASVGGSAEELFGAAHSAEVTAAYEANTQEAIDRRFYGSPTYVVDGDPFYGQDRLELVERACVKPFGPAPA